MSSPIAKSTSPAPVIRHYFLCRLHCLICKYSTTKTEKVTKDIISYLWNNMPFTSTFRLNCLANLSASSNLCLWSNLDNLKKRQSCHDYELQPMTSVQNFNMENNTTTTLPVFRECFCKRPDSQAGNLLSAAWEEKWNITKPQSLFWHTLKIHDSGYLNCNNINPFDNDLNVVKVLNPGVISKVGWVLSSGNKNFSDLWLC